jgi:putative salt-induced outer membrane protein YdiY
MRRRAVVVIATLALATLVTSRAALAQDEETELGWSDTAELTAVFTGGNAEASTFGFKNELARTWEDAALVLSVGALRAESTTSSRAAVGDSPASFRVIMESVSALTAESYYARGQYDRDLNARTFWYAGGGWDRNTFAGVQNRYSGGGGLGNTWVDNDQSTFKSGYGLTYTRQEDVVGTDATFGGLRLSYDYRRLLTATTEFTSVLVADESLNDTADFRTDLINAIAVSMSSQLALKVSWQLLYDHQPSLVGLPLLGAGGAPTGDTVFAELGTVDNLLTFALVATF